AVRAGRILAVGPWADLRPLVGRATEVVDAEGAVALPAFHDAHLHLLGYARTHSRLDCREARGIGELQALLAARARGPPAGERLLAWGVASVQDASHTNGPEEWALFQRLAARNALRVRLFFMPGARHWQDLLACHRLPLPPGEGRADGPRVALGPVKLMLDEA